MKGYLAVDIGASSGRVMLGQLDETKKITLTELHRFKNGATKQGNYKVWDIEQLLQDIVTGMQKAKQAGVTECTLGIDTWGVDYCLLDEFDQRIGPAIAYRDARTENAVDELSRTLSLKEIYQKTGIQTQSFNTLFQLFVEEPARLEKAKSLLFTPDYLNYRLTGVKAIERTIASTSQLLNLKTGTFDTDLLSALHLAPSLFPPLVSPGTVLGPLKKENFPNLDLPAVQVIAVASHDTAAAVLATPGDEQDDWAYLSSGTWSLLGSENQQPLVSPASFDANYTNEEGYTHTYRFLKNIMGMWLIQEVSRNYDGKYSFAEFVELAKKEAPFAQLIDVNDDAFLHPDNMITALQDYCRKTAQTVPSTPGQLARAIYDNLALCYTVALKELAELLDHPLNRLLIVGGGSQNNFLNQLTADVSGLTVYAGPVEATALGNIMTQLLTEGEFSSVASARQSLKDSFPQTVFTPNTKLGVAPLAAYEKFIHKGEK